jgi:hypothetical protein
MEQTVEPRLAKIERPGYQEAWERATSQLRMSIPPAYYDSWVQPLQPLGFKEGVFRIGAINAYGRDWVESRLNSQITRLLTSILQQPVQVRFVLTSGASSEKSGDTGFAGLPLADSLPVEQTDTVKPNGTRGKNKAAGKQNDNSAEEGGSPRKIQLQRAYGTERARVIQPERGMFLTMYFFNNWLPLLGQSAMTTVIAARSLCYWNPMTGEMRNTVETDMSELARRASVSVRTVKDVLNNELIKRYFLRYKVRRVMTPNGVRTAGIVLRVRMDDPLTPEDQDTHHLTEDDRWYTADFEDESEYE